MDRMIVVGIYNFKLINASLTREIFKKYKHITFRKDGEYHLYK